MSVAREDLSRIQLAVESVDDAIRRLQQIERGAPYASIAEARIRELTLGHRRLVELREKVRVEASDPA